MLKTVMPHGLKLYYENLELLLKFWPECWHLIYLADDRMRSEQFERIRREILASIAAGDPAPAHWDAANPWTAVFVAASKDKDYWDKHVKSIAASWPAHGARGAPKAPEEQFAQLNLPGVRPDLTPGGDGRRKRDALSRSPSKPGKGKRKGKRKRKEDRLRERLDKYETKDGRGGGKNNKGNQKQSPKEQDCFSFSKSFGVCKDCEPDSVCPAGRKHRCHLRGGAHKASACPKKKSG
jgi:hypothetical protein